MAAHAVQVDERRISMMLDRLLLQAEQERASDLHLEPRQDRLKVRFRVDGVMVERPNFPATFAKAFTSRLKVLAGLDISEKRLPQDGVFHLERGKQAVNFRISTFPTEFGEKVVLRLLPRNAQKLELARLGVGAEMAGRLRRIISGQNGILLVTGPTGSGKTSMLYSLLSELDSQRRNIVTLEDPVEYRLDGITQGQTNPKHGFDFAVGLRALLRQDPDVIMVGEIRDTETAQVAFRAALTGHLVISTLHTNSTTETLVRLLDMGVERFVVAAALRAVVSQRLIRQLCPLCRVPRALPQSALEGLSIPPKTVVYAPGGCVECSRTGYRGRTGLFELVEIDEAFADLIKDPGVSARHFQAEMERQDVSTLRQTGISRVLRGITSVEEVLRVT